jgi:hypothetical protein
MTDSNHLETAPPEPNRHKDTGARVAWAGISIVSSGAFLWGAWQLLHLLSPNDLASLLDRRGLSVIGVPAAVFAATVFVGVMRVVEGQFRFDFLGLKLEGAAASACLWIGAFLAISVAIRFLW